MKTSLALVLLLVAVASANYGNTVVNTGYGNNVVNTGYGATGYGASGYGNANSILNLASLSLNPVSGLAIVIPHGPSGRPQVVMPGTNVAIDVYWGYNPPIRVPGEQVVSISDKDVIGVDQQGNQYSIVPKVALEPNGNAVSLGWALFREVNLQNPNVYASTGYAAAAAGAAGAAAAGGAAAAAGAK